MEQNILNKIKLSNPEKNLWDKPEITKLGFSKGMLELAPFLIKYCKDRLLTCVRYPDGVKGKFFYQKNAPDYTPSWINTIESGDVNYINLTDEKTLLWLCNLACMEFHVSFNKIDIPDIPNYIVLDLDPSKGVNFQSMIEAALLIRDELKKLSISSLPKTSGATGIQILIPHGNKLNYQEGRKFNTFLANYFVKKYSKIFTIERKVDERGRRIYFDYLQMWTGKTLIAPYSPRAREGAPISMPLEWPQLKEGVIQTDFNLINCSDLLAKRGDILSGYDDTPNNSIIEIIKEI